MDVEDAENEVSVSSFLLNSIYSQQADVLSPEDLAWIDSCLVEDSDFSETDWAPLKDVLLEVISSQHQPFSIDREDIEILQEKIESVDLGLDQETSTHDMLNSSEASSTYNVNPIGIAVQMSDDDNPEPSSTFMGSPFLSTYNEDLKVNDTNDVGFDLDSSTFELEHASENIFKIWDLNIPTEDDLVKELDKVLSEGSFGAVSSSFDDSRKWKDWKDVSVDDLIDGIADLSLNRKA